MDIPFIGLGFSQLALVLVVAYLFLGPERLPEVARQIAKWVKVLRGYAADVQGQLTGEMGELRDEFLEIQRDLSSIQGNLRGGLLDLDSTVRAVGSEVQTVANDVRSSAAPTVVSLPALREARVERPPDHTSLDYKPAAPARKPRTAPSLPATAAVPPLEGPGRADEPRLPDFKPAR